MQIFSLILTVAAATSSLALGFVAYKKDKKSATNLLFLMFCIDVFFWVIVGYFSIYPTFIENPLIFIRLTIFLAAGQTALLFLLMHTFPTKKLHIKKKNLWAIIVFTVFTMLITISPYAFTEAIVTDSIAEAIPGPGLAVFGLETTFFICGAIYLLLKKYKKSEGILRQQLLIILIGVSVMFSLIILTIFLPVAIFQYNKFVPFHPLYTIFFQICTTYAIIRYRFMDIRFAVKRGTAYLVSIVVVLSLYTMLILFSQQTLVSRYHWNNTITTTVAVLLIAVSVEPLRRIIIRFVNNMLYSPMEKQRQAIQTDKPNQLSTAEKAAVYAEQAEFNERAETHIQKVVGKLVNEHLGFLHNSDISLMVADWPTKTMNYIYGHRSKPQSINPDEPLYVVINANPKILITKEIPYMMNDQDQDKKQYQRELLDDVVNYLEQNNIEAVIPVGKRDMVFGVFLIGPKPDKKLYNDEDIKALEYFRVYVAPLIHDLIQMRVTGQREIHKKFNA